MSNRQLSPKVEKAVIACLRLLARRGRELRLQGKTGSSSKA